MAEEQTVPNDPVTHDLTRILAGEAVPVDCIDVQREAAMQFVPKTKSRMGYIVMTVVFDDQGRVLLVQEAKLGCRGTWYLPAGRLEPGENIVDGAKREIVEEAGLECDINTMYSLHYPVGHWMRLCFYGTVSGGKLKTLEEQDEESLQAAFYDLHTVFNNGLPLRKKDILPVIKLAMEYRSSLSSVPMHPPLLPVISAHRHMIHRPVLVADLGCTIGLQMLVGTRDTPHLLTAAVAPDDNTLHVTLHVIVKVESEQAPLNTTEVTRQQCSVLSPQDALVITETNSFKTRFQGVLGVEHCGTGQGTDGMCITTLVSLVLSEGQGLPPVRNDSYAWVAVSDAHCSSVLCQGLAGTIVKIV